MPRTYFGDVGMLRGLFAFVSGVVADVSGELLPHPTNATATANRTMNFNMEIFIRIFVNLIKLGG